MTLSWQGLDEFMSFLTDTIPLAVNQEMSATIDMLGNETMAIYLENLSGMDSSTAESPLPVGVITGNLLSAARLEMNTEAGAHTFNIVNDAEYAGYIENGTSKMAPRQPLQNALDQMAKRYDEELDNCMQTITAAGG